MENEKIKLTTEERLVLGGDLLRYMNLMLEYQEKYLFTMKCLFKITRSYPEVVKECLSDSDMQRIKEGV